VSGSNLDSLFCAKWVSGIHLWLVDDKRREVLPGQGGSAQHDSCVAHGPRVACDGASTIDRHARRDRYFVDAGTGVAVIRGRNACERSQRSGDDHTEGRH